MSDSIVVNVISPEVTNINVTDTGENIYINPLTLNQGIINHSVTHQSGGSDELLHNLLGGLQGGSGGNYYHLTSGEYANLVTGAVIRPSDTGAFYPNYNPSGFITGVDLSAYVTGDVVRPSETGNFITTTQTGDFYPRSNPSGFIIPSQTGAFYASSNPSGFITGVDLSAYVTGEVVRPSQTGEFYPASNPSGFITGVDLSAYVTGSVVRPSETGNFIAFTALTGDRGDITVTGNSPNSLNFSIDNSAVTNTKIADGAVTTAKIANFNITTDKLGSLAVTTNIIASNAVTNTKLADMASQRIKGRISAGTSDPEDLTASQVRTLIDFDHTVSGLLSGYVTGSVVRPSETGSFITTAQTGAFYPVSNPSGYVTGSVVRPSETGSFITSSQTGAFYAASNPSGFITGVDLSFSGNYYTKSESESRYVNATGAETILGDKTFHDKVYINNLYVTGLETIVNTTNTNVASNFIMLNLTGGAVDGGLFFVTGSGLTGINDSGAILGFDHSDKFKFGIGTRASDLSVLDTIASVEEMTGISGSLQTQISSLSNATGSYVLSSQTGAFYPTSNPSGFVTGSVVRPSETGSFITSSQTGVFYPTSNPSGFVTAVDPVRTTLTGNGLVSGYAISGAANLINPSALIVAIDGVLQEPVVDYSVNNGTITFTEALASGAKAVVISPSNALIAGQVTPSDGSVTSSKIATGVTLTTPSLVGPVDLTSQDATTADRVMTRGLADARYSQVILNIYRDFAGRAINERTVSSITTTGTSATVTCSNTIAQSCQGQLIMLHNMNPSALNGLYLVTAHTAGSAVLTIATTKTNTFVSGRFSNAAPIAKITKTGTNAAKLNGNVFAWVGPTSSFSNNEILRLGCCPIFAEKISGTGNFGVIGVDNPSFLASFVGSNDRIPFMVLATLDGLASSNEAYLCICRNFYNASSTQFFRGISGTVQGDLFGSGMIIENTTDY